jgi:tetratricopeptide (TPR) repeat protein
LGLALAETGGRLEDAERVFAQASEEAAAIGDRRTELRAAIRRPFYWMLRSSEATHEDGLREARRVIPDLEALGDDAGLAEALRLQGMVLIWAGKLGEALDTLEQAAHRAGRAGDRGLEARILKHIGLALYIGPTPVGRPSSGSMSSSEDTRTV